MKSLWTALASGLLMGAGFVISGMNQPEKVLGFLDIAGSWDPSLLLVMAGAVAVNLPASRWILGRKRPLLASGFHLPARQSVDRQLIVGSALFGIGWGLAGICPGPGIANLFAGGRTALLFILAMVVGFWLYSVFDRKK